MQHTSKPYRAWFYLWNGKVSVIPLSSTNGDMLIATSRLPSIHSGDGEFRVLNILKDDALNRNLPKVTISPYNAHSVNSEQNKQTNKTPNPKNQTKTTPVNHFRFFFSNLY